MEIAAVDHVTVIICPAVSQTMGLVNVPLVLGGKNVIKHAMEILTESTAPKPVCIAQKV